MIQYCSSCGSELAPNAKFCTRCGQAVAAMPQEEASSPQTPSSDRPRGGVRRWFAGASTPWTAMLVVSVVLAVSLVGVAAWLAVARSGEEEERTPTAPAGLAAGAVGATATPRAAASPAAPAPTLPSGRLAFVSERDGNSDIYVMNADGSGQTNLTKN
ncbi:MAG: zinc-ribbon domain-containing protein, partial [Bacillota bacterium]|nr:zinc-ribbon domain-containing protein [Bacillota bacterium]